MKRKGAFLGLMMLAVAAFMTGGCRHGGAYQKEKPHGN